MTFLQRNQEVESRRGRIEKGQVPQQYVLNFFIFSHSIWEAERGQSLHCLYLGSPWLQRLASSYYIFTKQTAFQAGFLKFLLYEFWRKILAREVQKKKCLQSLEVVNSWKNFWQTPAHQNFTENVCYNLTSLNEFLVLVSLPSGSSNRAWFYTQSQAMLPTYTALFSLKYFIYLLWSLKTAWRQVSCQWYLQWYSQSCPLIFRVSLHFFLRLMQRFNFW